MLREIATRRIVDRGETFTSNMSGLRATVHGNYTDHGVDFVMVVFEGEEFPRNVLAKNFGLYNA